MLRKFVGYIDGTKRVEVVGETLKEAMAAAGYIPLNGVNNVNRYVGQLTTGQRFSFNLSPRSHFQTPYEVKCLASIHRPLHSKGEN